MLQQTTFTYNSSLWTNKSSYNEQAGRNMASDETKMATYWATPFTSLCLGMRYEEQTRWIKLDYQAKSLYDVISSNQHRATNISISTWKNLLNESSVQVTWLGGGHRPAEKGLCIRCFLVFFWGGGVDQYNAHSLS